MPPFPALPFKIAFGLALILAGRAGMAEAGLEVRWSKGVLATFDGAELKKTKAKNGSISVTSLAEEAFKGLTAADKSRLDLVLLDLVAAPPVWIPWAALKTLRVEIKVPELTFKVRLDGASVSLPYAGVVAWEGKTVSAIEFSNVQDRLGKWFLTKRTDPIALKGEKLFVQGCASCHAQGSPTGLPQVKSRLQAAAEGGFEHAAIASAPAGFRLPKLSDKDARALRTYVMVSPSHEP